jgi:hypothetical protein
MSFLQEGVGYHLGKEFRHGLQGAEANIDVPSLPEFSWLQRLEEIRGCQENACERSHDEAISCPLSPGTGCGTGEDGVFPDE